MLAKILMRPAKRREQVPTRVGNCPRPTRLSWRPVIATALLAVLATTASADLVCRGWSSERAARESCCTRMESACAAVSVDACCAAREGRAASEMTLARPLPAADTASAGIVIPASGIFHRHGPAPLTPGDSPPAYILHSVLLI